MIRLFLIFLFAMCTGVNAQLYINPDGGDWITIDSVLSYSEGGNSPSYYFNISCYDSSNCIGHYGDFLSASQYSRIRKTTDGGNTWFDIRIDSRPPDYPLKRFVFYPEKDLIVIGCDSGYVLRTSDGGENWDYSQKITTLEPFYFELNRMYMKGKIGILQYSGLDNIFITSDGGENWSKMQFNTNPQLKYPGATFNIIDSNILIMSSWVNTVNDTSMYFFKSYDRGKTWSQINKISKKDNFYSFFTFINEKTGFSRHLELLVKGDIFKGTKDTSSTSFYKTTDGGLTWNKIYEIIEQGGGFGNFTVADSLNFIAVNTSGAHLRTTDGGISWQKSPYFTFEGEYQVGSTSFTNTFMSPTTPLLGYGPRILKYVGKSTSVKDNFNLPQISFSIHPNPATEYIEINIENKGLQPLVHNEEFKIYNMLGESVIELPDVQHLGDVGHLQRIDISHLHRGVYYVRIGSRTQMIVKM
ncbi:MAG: hypothetical protein CVV22_04445 [Ignavibacteriae bacterium HGW-Ignavibacteriae-1]|jgi:photosystem II stability/assembly factor-like uncharacterized protein|nr:MAG: hypothetical protein CVV22_04445 [Ignavibacteriae bacterium HGW-Ignavibacteriae-1]